MVKLLPRSKLLPAVLCEKALRIAHGCMDRTTRVPHGEHEPKEAWQFSASKTTCDQWQTASSTAPLEASVAKQSENRKVQVQKEGVCSDQDQLRGCLWVAS